MGWISMSERDLRRIEVLSEVRTGRRTVAAPGLRQPLLKLPFCRTLTVWTQ